MSLLTLIRNRVFPLGGLLTGTPRALKKVSTGDFSLFDNPVVRHKLVLRGKKLAHQAKRSKKGSYKKYA